MMHRCASFVLLFIYICFVDFNYSAKPTFAETVFDLSPDLPDESISESEDGQYSTETVQILAITTTKTPPVSNEPPPPPPLLNYQPNQNGIFPSLKPLGISPDLVPTIPANNQQPFLPPIQVSPSVFAPPHPQNFESINQLQPSARVIVQPHIQTQTPIPLQSTRVVNVSHPQFPTQSALHNSQHSKATPPRGLLHRSESIVHTPVNLPTQRHPHEPISVFWFKERYDVSTCSKDFRKVAAEFQRKLPRNIIRNSKDTKIIAMVERILTDCHRKSATNHWNRISDLLPKVALSLREQMECYDGLVEEQLACMNLSSFICQFIHKRFQFRLIPTRIIIKEMFVAEEGAEKCRKIIKDIQRRKKTRLNV